METWQGQVSVKACVGSTPSDGARGTSGLSTQPVEVGLAVVQPMLGSHPVEDLSEPLMLDTFEITRDLIELTSSPASGLVREQDSR